MSHLSIKASRINLYVWIATPFLLLPSSFSSLSISSLHSPPSWAMIITELILLSYTAGLFLSDVTACKANLFGFDYDGKTPFAQRKIAWYVLVMWRIWSKRFFEESPMREEENFMQKLLAYELNGVPFGSHYYQKRPLQKGYIGCVCSKDVKYNHHPH